jgi:hypothetical protein
MADRVNERQQIARASDEHAAEPPLPRAVGIARRRAGRADVSPHSSKFRAATAMLVGVAIGAVAVALVVLASGSHNISSGKWSDWSPPDSGTAGAREIADHIAPLYRISGTDQLDVVTVVNLANAAAAAAAASSGSSTPTSGLQVAVRADPSSSAVSLLNGQTIAYNLCGIGSTNCSIGVGSPSTDRLLLLRREALELALYTFKYIGGISNVVALLPPGHTTQGCSGICPKPNAKQTTKAVDIAVLFVKGELAPWLSQPLRDTFPEQFPPPVSELSLWRQTTEAGLVDQITARGLFSEQLVQAQDGSNLIVLDPLPPQ